MNRVWTKKVRAMPPERTASFPRRAFALEDIISGRMLVVPARPTDAMLDAGLEAVGGGSTHMCDLIEKVYCAMLSARPTTARENQDAE